MVKFFINRPIVAMVISIIMTIIGIVSILGLPVAQFPDIVPPEIMVDTIYVGADAITVEESVATPIEQQISGVENMNYMYSYNSNDGRMMLRVNFKVGSDPNTDQILTQMRQAQATPQLPSEVKNYGVTVLKSTMSPTMLFTLISPNGTYDDKFLTNYAYINLYDALLRVRGVGQVQIYGAGQYAMRLWVNPDRLAKLDITVNDILNAIEAQNKANPAGTIGGEPVPPGQEFTYAVRAQGRLVTAEQFGDIIVRAKPDGSLVRIKDVARVELGVQTYNIVGRLNGEPSAIIALYQTPGTNAIEMAESVRKLFEDAKERFPQDLDYVCSLDTTLAITEGIEEIVKTLVEAMVLVIIVVFIFLQSFRATLIPMLAVPVSLVSTFALFPLLGFSINTLSLLGLVLAIGLVVDDAIVVVEAVEHHIEQGLAPREATVKAMEEVSGPVVAIALILASVFLPTVFIPGISGRLYTQFAVTIAVSVIISAFNALSLSPALAALVLRPKRETKGPLGFFFGWFNRTFNRATDRYVSICGLLMRKAILGLIFLGLVGLAGGYFGKLLPGSFLPEEDQGYFFINISLPDAASLQRSDAVCRQVEKILEHIPGVKYYTTVVGFSLLSSISSTYASSFFVTLEEWAKRKKPEEKYDAILMAVNQQLAMLPQASAFAFSPPSIPGIGNAGGVTFILEDRAGKDISFLAKQTDKFLAAASKRPEIARIGTTLLPDVPQLFAHVNREKVLMQGVSLEEVYETLQAFMGGVMVNYFNRFGRVWQVYVQAEGKYRTSAENVGRFYVRNNRGDAVPLSSVVFVKPYEGPEFTMRFNLYRSAQINAFAAPGYSSAQAMKALEEVFAETMPREMGYDYFGMSYQEYLAGQGVPPAAVFGLSLLFVFLLLAALYESWSLPLSVLLGTPIAVFGAFAALWLRSLENNVYAQIGLVMIIGLAAKNAILIVEFAKMRFEEGSTIYDAALEGAQVRLRAILMTSFAFVLGCVPLWIASGAGAAARRNIGTTVIGGMAAATGIAIFIIPLTFFVVEKLSRRGGKDRSTSAGTQEVNVDPGGEHS